MWPDSSPLFLPALVLEGLAAGAGVLIGRASKPGPVWRAALACFCGLLAVLGLLGYAYALVQTGKA